MKPIPKVESAPPSLAGMAATVNALVDAIAALKNAKGTGGITVTVTDKDLTVSTDQGMKGGKLEKFTICVSGAPETRWIRTFTSGP